MTTMEIIDNELSTQVATITEQAGHLLVKDSESLAVANQYLVDLSKMKKVVIEHYKPMKEAANKAHKAITSQEKADLAPIDEADRVVRSLTGAYVEKEERKRQKEQDRLNKLAREKAEREEAKLREKAEKAAAEGNKEEEERLLDKAENVYAEPKIAAPTVDKTSRVEGGGSVSFITDIEIEVYDQKEFILAISRGDAPLTVIEFKLAKIKAWIKANGIKQGQVPGIRIKETKRQSVRV